MPGTEPRNARCLALTLTLLLLAGPASGPSLGAESAAIPVIIDTDMDSDDAMAILYLLSSKKVEVLGLSVSGNGFMLPIDGVPVGLKIARLGGRPQLPVAYGELAGLLDVSGFPAQWREGAMQFYRQADLPEIATPPYAKPAADLIGDLVRASERKVTILGLGPNTNIALALAREPSLLANIDRIVLSAGAFEVAGNLVDSDTPETLLESSASYRSFVAGASKKAVAEYNVFLDAPATSNVIQLGGEKVLFSPLDASQMAPVDQKLVDDLKARPRNPVTAFVLGDIGPLLQQKIPTFLWDPVAAALIVDPSICTELEISKVHVVVDDSPSFGQTVAGGFGRDAGICFAIDTAKFYADFIDTLSRVHGPPA